jgi:hypothetical protein
MKQLGRAASRGVYARLHACHFVRAVAIGQRRLATPDGTKPASNASYVILKNEQNGWSKRELACISRSGQ